MKGMTTFVELVDPDHYEVNVGFQYKAVAVNNFLGRNFLYQLTLGLSLHLGNAKSLL